MPQPVIIVDSDSTWPEQFNRLRSVIAPALGDLAAAIEHVGSTSIPGLPAKPIIDIDVLLSSADGLHRAIASLAALGYAHRGDLGVAGREAFHEPSRVPSAPSTHHLYVCLPDSLEYRRHIAFRDYLRAHPDSAQAYAGLKRSLAIRYRDDREKYNEGKKDFVNEILRRALRPANGAPS